MTLSGGRNRALPWIKRLSMSVGCGAPAPAGFWIQFRSSSSNEAPSRGFWPGREDVLSTAKKVLLVAAGYALAVAAGLAAVTINEALMPEDISQTSGGMVAFGDMILFVLATGFVSILPTFFLLKLGLDKAPRVLLAAAIVVVVIGPLSWLAMVSLASDASPSNPTLAVGALAGPLIAFIGIPRMVFGPVLLLIEGVAFFIMRQRLARMLLAGAMLLDIVPLSLFALHMARAGPY
jgi:hypothetical protein